MAPDREEISRESLSRRLDALMDAAVRLGDVTDTEGVLHRIVRGAADVVDARYAALALYEQGRIETFVHWGVDQQTVDAIGRYPEGRGLLGEVLTEEGPIRLEDVAAHPGAVGFPRGHPEMRSFLGVPLTLGHRHGSLYLAEKRGGGAFQLEDERLASVFAAFAAVVIESAELVDLERARMEVAVETAAAEEHARTRQEMLGEVLNAQERERARVARDLHDDVGQALTSVLLGLRLVAKALEAERIDKALDHLVDLRHLVANALGRTRRLASELRPTVLDDIGLVPALERLAEDLSDRTEIKLGVVSDGLAEDERLPAPVETVVYRVTQEALTNVLRHSRAINASVALEVGAGWVRVVVEDDGVGFDREALSTEPHLGLKGMTERAALVGGVVTVSSMEGSGTTVCLEVPLG